MRDIEKLIGQKFNRLTVLGISNNKTKAGITKLIIKCDCGTVKDVNMYYVLNSSTKSCGCLQKSLLINQTYTTKYIYNTNLFKELNANSFYILGLFSSDGNISKEKGKGSIGLHEEDKYLLEKISLLVKNSDKLIYTPPTKCTGIATGYSSAQYRFYFCNKEIYSDLLQFGITPNKSKTIQVDERLKDSIDFWRGVFDGDGSVQIISRKSGRKIFKITLCSASLSFITSYKDFCYRNTYTKANVRNVKDKGFYTFSLTGDSAKRIYKLLYDTSSDLYLKRKKKYLKEII